MEAAPGSAVRGRWLIWVAVLAFVFPRSVVPAAPPSYLWGYGDPFLCGNPKLSETLQAVDATRRAGPVMPGSSASRLRVLLVGDSTACSLWPGLHAVGDANGIPTDQGSVFGCGIAVDEIATTRREQSQRAAAPLRRPSSRSGNPGRPCRATLSRRAW